MASDVHICREREDARASSAIVRECACERVRAAMYTRNCTRSAEPWRRTVNVDDECSAGVWRWVMGAGL